MVAVGMSVSTVVDKLACNLSGWISRNLTMMEISTG